MSAQTESHLMRRKRAFGKNATNFEPGRAAEYAMLAVELYDLRASRASRTLPAHERAMAKWADRAKLRGFGLRDFPTMEF